MVEVMKIIETSFQRSHAHSAPNPAAGHCQHMPPLETPVHSQASLDQSLVRSLLLSPGSWCIQGSVCALQESVSPVLCEFWWFYGVVNGDLLHDGLCHTQVCCTQSPCGRPLLTCASTEDTQTLLAQSLWVGCVFCALPRSKKLRQPGAWQITSPVSAAWFPGHAARALSQVCYVSPLES